MKNKILKLVKMLETFSISDLVPMLECEEYIN